MPVYKSNHPMSAASFRTVRSFLGLSDQWIATHLGVHVRTVRKWGAGDSSVPKSAAAFLRELDVETASAVSVYVEAFTDHEDSWPFRIPRSDEESEGWEEFPGKPVGWWRNLAARVCQRVPGLWIDFAPADSAGGPADRPILTEHTVEETAEQVAAENAADAKAAAERTLAEQYALTEDDDRGLHAVVNPAEAVGLEAATGSSASARPAAE